MSMKYGFYDRLNDKFPSQIIVDVTEVCNLACIHCPHPSFKKSEHYTKRYLDVALHKKMVDEVQEYGIGATQYIRYTSNGEPLVHPKIYDMLEYAVLHSGVFVTLTTNGTILNEKRIEKLLTSGLHVIDISIDAHTQKTYGIVRVNGDLAVTHANIKKLLEIKRRTNAKTRIVVSYVEQPENMHETELFETYWNEQGIDGVVIRRLHSAAGGVQSIASTMHESQFTEERYPCLYPWERTLINPRGELAFCPQDWVHGSVVGNYQNVSVRDLWSGDIYKALREAHLNNDFSCHEYCGQCPDWAQTRWPGEGRSYADLVQELAIK